jgi:hypothetical protein
VVQIGLFILGRNPSGDRKETMKKERKTEAREMEAALDGNRGGGVSEPRRGGIESGTTPESLMSL